MDLESEEQPPLDAEGIHLGLEQDERKAECKGGTRGELVEELIPVQVHPTNLTKTTRIGALLHEEAWEGFKAFL